MQTDNNLRIEQILKEYSDLIYKLCFLNLSSTSDIDDVFQDVFLKLISTGQKFNDPTHEKAWIIRTTINRCKDVNKSFNRKLTDSIEDKIISYDEDFDKVDNQVLKAVMNLPEKYKQSVYLFFYEGYTVPDIAKLLNAKENTIYSNIHRAKAILKKQLGGDLFE